MKIRTVLGKAKRKVYNTARNVFMKSKYGKNLTTTPKYSTPAPQQPAPEAVKAPAREDIPNSTKIKDDSIKTVMCLHDKYCCGCGACANICPVDAITMKFNSEGFLQPSVDMSVCTECGACKKLCPSLNTVYKNNAQPDCYAAYTIDSIREKSSSGGIFTVLAEEILSMGGYVCGASYDGEFTVKHTIIADKKDLDILRKSKYVQSDTGFVFREIKKLLQQGKYVLFCGCGCQVAGLNAALGNKSYDNLYTIDLMCHGSPSPGLFKQYLETHYDKDKIDFVGFREKDYFGWSTEMTVRYDDGEVMRNTRTMDPYYKAFLPCISVREYCGVCAFSALPRQGDITLADFWGVEKYNRDFTDGKGTSIVTVNSEHGAALWEKVKRNLVLCEKIPFEYVLKTGQPFAKPFKNHPFRKGYFELIKAGATMEKAFDYSTKRKFDVAILGVWYGANYGSVATYYALNRLISSFGLSVLMVDRPGNDDVYEISERCHSRQFALKHYNISRRYLVKDLKQLNNYADTFVMGSDQIWNRGVNRHLGMTFYLNFVDDTKKKISYAASFGHGTDFASAADRVTISQLLDRFDGISVRETSAVDMCKEFYNADAVRVLDPVFAADREIFDELTEEVKEPVLSPDDNYLTAYILDPSDEKRDAVKYACERLGLKPLIMLDGNSRSYEEDKKKIYFEGCTFVEGLNVEKWLHYIKNSKFVLTDSCHGASFAIIFGRELIAISNPRRGKLRFDSLMSLFDITNRLVEDGADILDNDKLFAPMDYDNINAILKSEKERSVNWLREKLFAPKIIDSYCAYPVIDKRIADKLNFDPDNN